MLEYYMDKKLDVYEIKECANTTHSIKEHFHKELTVVLIEEGSTTVIFKNVEHRFHEGELIIIPPNMVHQCNPDNLNKWKFTLLYIDMDWINDNFNFTIKKSILLNYQLDIGEIKEIKSCFTTLKYDKTLSKSTALKKLIKKYVIGRYSYNNFISIKIQERDKILRVKQYIEENYQTKITLKDLEKISGLSKYHLLRTFQGIYNISPLVYQKSIRFNMAKQQLKMNHNISGIAVGLGYYDQSHFTNDFQKFAGITPNSYKKS